MWMLLRKILFYIYGVSKNIISAIITTNVRRKESVVFSLVTYLYIMFFKSFRLFVSKCFRFALSSASHHCCDSCITLHICISSIYASLSYSAFHHYCNDCAQFNARYAISRGNCMQNLVRAKCVRMQG